MSNLGDKKMEGKKLSFPSSQSTTSPTKVDIVDHGIARIQGFIMNSNYPAVNRNLGGDSEIINAQTERMDMCITAARQGHRGISRIAGIIHLNSPPLKFDDKSTLRLISHLLIMC